VCWYGRISPDSDIWFQICTRAADHDNGTITLPCCPNHPLEKVFLVHIQQIDGDECECLADVFVRVDWEPVGEPYGRWRGEYRGCDSGPIEVLVYPGDCTETGTMWTVDLIYESRSIGKDSVDVGCGNYPKIGVMELSDLSPCPGALISITCEP